MNSYNSTIKRQNPTKKWAKDLNRHFSKEHKQMASKSTKRYSISLVIKIMPNEATRRCYPTSTRIAQPTKMLPVVKSDSPFVFHLYLHRKSNT